MTTTKTQIKKGDVIKVEGRRWFDKVNGNTYFTAAVYLNGEIVTKLPFEYGYESHYEDRAMHEFWKSHTAPKGFDTDFTHCSYLQDYGVTYSASAKDVLKRELHKF